METARKYLNANKTAFDKYTEMCRNIECDYETKDNYVYSVNNMRTLENEINILINPLKFISAIVSRLNIYESTFVCEMIGTTAISDKYRIKADKIIITTHFPFINKHGSYFLKLYQHRSYVIALENAQYINGMYVDENHKGMSFRNYGDLLFVGGGGHRTA